MKKLRSLFLIVVACLVSILFTDKVFAEVVIEYPVYSGNVYLDENLHCDACGDGGYGEDVRDQYKVSEDDGIYDDEIRITNVNDSSDTYLLKKSEIAYGFVVSTTGTINTSTLINDWYKITTDQLKTIDGVTKIKYFKYEDTNDVLINASENDIIYEHIYGGKYSIEPVKETEISFDTTVKKGVTLIIRTIYSDTIKNDGIIETGGIIGCKKITGSGIIDLNYSIYGSSILGIDEISGVKINLTNTELKEGLEFAIIGSADEFTVGEAQKKIDMYNSALGNKMSDYGINLAVDEYSNYYGVLVKKENVKKATNTLVKKELTSTGKIKGSIEFANSISNNYVLDIKSIEVKKDLANKDVKYIVDISVLENGLVVKIDNNKMKIKIAIPEELKGYKKYEVVYISDDKIKETIPATIEDGYIVFETSHLSEYGIIAKEKQGVKNPKTGDTILYIVGAIILSASALVVSYKKIRQN